jgi:hypothetical protein
MRWIASKFMPWLLTDDQKQHWLEVGVEHKEQVNNDPTEFKVGLVFLIKKWEYIYIACVCNKNFKIHVHIFCSETL